MVIEPDLELKNAYNSCIEWIERRVETIREDEEPRDALVSLFSEIYKTCFKEVADTKYLSVLLLDCIFYSLLSDVRSKIHKICVDCIENWGKDKKLIVLVEGKQREEIRFINYCFKLFSAGTNLYFDEEKPREIEQELEVQEFSKLELKNILEYVACYLCLYAKGRRELPTTKLLIELEEKSNLDHPYIDAGYINIKLKVFDDDKSKGVPTKEEINKLKELAKTDKFPPFNKGYYNLLLARYYNIQGDFNEAKFYCDFALDYTNKYCRKNGERINDIRRLRLEIIKNISWKDQIKKIGKESESLIGQFMDLKKEVYSVIGIIITAVVIPLSIITIFFRVEEDIRTLGFAISLGGLIIVGLIVTVAITTFLPILYSNRKFYKHKKK